MIPVLLLALACGRGRDEDTDVENLPPQADAGLDVAQPADRPVQLDGRASYDPEGDTLQFVWRFDAVPPGSVAADREAPFSANHDTSGTTSFWPDAVGLYVVELIVWDGVHGSAPAYVIVDAQDPERVPVAVAGADQAIDLGQSVIVDGSRSYDPVGYDLTYAWSLIDGPRWSALTTADLAGADAAEVSFTPDAFGDYVLALTVDNGLATSAPDTVTIHVAGDDAPPTADAGDDAEVPDCSRLEVDCSGSTDPEGAPLQYFWDVQSVPAGSAVTRAAFDDPDDAATAFDADVVGDYVLSCSVFDGTTWSVPDAVTVTVTERTTNGRPVAKAGADRLLSQGFADCVPSGAGYDCDTCAPLVVELGLDGEASDPDGDELTVEWLELVESDAEILDPTVIPAEAVLPGLEPDQPAACVEEEYEFRLVVTDCPGEVDRDTVRIVARCCGVE